MGFDGLNLWGLQETASRFQPATTDPLQINSLSVCESTWHSDAKRHSLRPSVLIHRKEGRDICCNLANSSSPSAFLRGSACHGEQPTPIEIYPKSPPCQRLCDTSASALRSRPTGTPQATRATSPRPPSQQSRCTRVSQIRPARRS